MAKKLSQEEVSKLKENAFGILTNIRHRLICEFPFIGNIAMKLNIVPIRDIRCRTASTDGTNIYFDIEFLSKLTDSQQMFVFAHEVWHNVLLHFVRRQMRDVDLFNIATDLEVNQLLKKDNMQGPSDLCWPSAFGVPEDKSAEVYYELLLKKNHNSKQTNSSGANSSGSSGSGNGNGNFSGQFDKHTYSNIEDETNNSENGIGGSNAFTGFSDKYGEISFDEDYNPTVTADAAEKMREAAVASAQMVERTRGSLPAHISAIVDQLKKPEIRWQEVLAQFVTRCIGEKRQWYPPSRRHVWHDCYLQSRRGEKIKLAVGIDTSGSTQSDIPKFLGELNSLVNSFGNYEIHLIQCDAQVEDYTYYSNDNPLDLENTKFKMSGGGGTVLHPIFQYVEDHQFDVDAYVVFTDGYVESFPKKDDPGKPTLWLLTADGDDSQIKFGEIIKFKNDKYEQH